MCRFPDAGPHRFPASWLAGVALTLLAAACGSSEGSATIAPIAVVVSASHLELVQQQTQQVSASVSGTSNRNVTWSSATPSIATVSQDGLVTAVSGGETSITAASVVDPTKNASLAVVVKFRVNVVQTPSTAELYVGGALPGAVGTTKLTATVTGAANTTVVWTSSSPAIATVDQSGTVTALDGTPAGNSPATVTITSAATADPTRTGATTITVFPAPTSGAAVTSGTPLTLNGATGDLTLYRLYVPPGTTNLTVTTSGGSGDLDLYVRRGIPIAKPPLNAAERALFTCVSEGSSSNESCTIASPVAGHYYIQIAGFEKYSGVTFLAKTSP